MYKEEINLINFGRVSIESSLIEIEKTSNNIFSVGNDGVQTILATPDKKVELIGFKNKTLAYVPSAMQYDAYYPIHPVTLQKPVKAVLMDLDGTSVKSEEFWIWIIERSIASLLDNPKFQLEEADLPYVSGHSVTEHLAYIKEFTEKVDADKLRTITGELRDGPSAACSGNALSTRLYIKQKNKKAQNMLLYKAEPLSATVSMLGGEYETEFLKNAWEYMLKSHAHDSINGVTQDKTARDNMYRLDQVIEIADAVSDRAMSDIISKADLSGYSDEDVLLIAYNPLPFAVSQILKVAVDYPADRDAWDFTVNDENGEKMAVQWISKDSNIKILHDLNSRPWPLHVDTHIVYMESGLIPAGGFKIYKVETNRTFERSFICGTPYQRTTFGDEIAQRNDCLENEYLKVTVNSNGTFDLFDKENERLYKDLHCFEDTGEVGDGWINLPPNRNRTYLSTASQASVWCENNGPISATIGIKHKMELPKWGERPDSFFGSGTKQSTVTDILEITTYLTLQKGSRRLDVKVEVDNNISDHRLRVLYPTELTADYSYAAGHYGVDKRPVMSKKSGVEYWNDMQTLPQQTFVDVTNGEIGLAFVNDSLTEYELSDDGKATLALTLLRCVQNRICTERRAINFFTEQNGMQCLGKQTATYSIYPHKGNWEEGNVYIEAQKFNAGVTVMQTATHNKGEIPAGSSFYNMSNNKLVMTAFKKCEDRDSLIFRFFNPTENEQSTEISFLKNIKNAYICNLNEERKENIIVSLNKINISVPHGKIFSVEVEF